MLLNIGCGEFKAKGWTNVDCWAGVNPDLLGDVGDLPLPDRCAERIYLGHVLEHLTLERLPGVLDEVRRVAKGPVCVVGPDVDRCRTPEERHGAAVGGHRWPGDEHHWECSEVLMLSLLAAAGWSMRAVPIANLQGSAWPVVSFAPWQFAAVGTCA